MPPRTTVTKISLDNIIACLTPIIPLLNEFSDSFGTPFIPAIANTTVSLITLVQNVKKNKEECIQLMGNILELLYAIINLHMTSGMGSSLPPATVAAIGELMETLHKVHAFMETQQDGNKIKHFFRQRLKQAVDMFKMKGAMNIHQSIVEMQKETEKIHKELLEAIATSSDATISDRSSSIHHWPNDLHNSSNSISMLPAKPKILYGRESELEDIVKTLNQDPARIAILGSGGMGKTSLAKAALHHPDVVSKYQHRFFVAADSTTTSIELAALIGLHIGLKPGEDLTKPVVHYFSNSSPSLLILDNLETLWEPMESRGGVEEFLSRLTDVSHLALMASAERPAKVHWTRPFLQPLKPLSDDAAYQTFVAIAEDFHDNNHITKLLSWTNNLPLAVDLIAHLVDHEGCENVLARWETEKTSLLSDGHDRRTSLAYEDDRKRLKVLVPIREHMQRFYPAPPLLIHQVENHFHLLLDIYQRHCGSQQVVGQETYIKCYSKDCIKTTQPMQLLLKASCITELFQSRLLHIIDNPEQLISQAICHFGNIDDLFLEFGDYSFFSQGNISRAKQFLDKALSLAKTCGKQRQQALILIRLAMILYGIGDYSAAQIQAHRAQRLAQLSGYLDHESHALWIEAMCARNLGDYKHSILLLHRGRALLELCGMSGSSLDHYITSSEAEAHLLKSEYAEAHKINAELVQNTQDTSAHAVSLLNLAQIDIMIGASAQNVCHNLDKARAITTAAGDLYQLKYCDIFSAELNLREGQTHTAKVIFQQFFHSAWKHDHQAAFLCLEKLADTSQWPGCDFGWASQWTVIYLVYARRTKNKRALHKALQFLGDIFLAQGDLNTAHSLFTVALETSTYMDIHQSRAECMLHLGDIARHRGDLAQAEDLWKEAHPLFERSLQTKDMAQIDTKLALVRQEVSDTHQKSLIFLSELQTPTMSLPIPSDINLLDIEAEHSVLQKQEKVLAHLGGQ
ncbi:hypothetical protein C8R44DRAFT_724378 [Mycena epipterygia]|nr:hypothetical protein C8R44DRAFT_724378 [Mycena epipterygia]